MLEESDSLLDIMQDDLNFSSFTNPHFIGTHGFWDHETSDGSDTVLPLPFIEDGPQPDFGIKEDFQKMLSDWQEHLGTLQSSDTEEMDVKDLVEMDINMSKNTTEEMPSDIFEDSCEMKTVLSVEKLHMPLKDRTFNGLALNLNENLNSFNLENFLEDDDEEEHKFGLIVAEEEKHANRSCVTLGLSQQLSPSVNVNSRTVYPVEATSVSNSSCKESEEEAVDVETVIDQIPVLEAGDLKSLLEQFEASEAFNCVVGKSGVEPSKTELSTVLDESSVSSSRASSHVKQKPTNTVSSVTSTVITSTSSIFPSVLTSATPTSGETKGNTLHETIRDSLPQEVIDRIKASNRRKAIPVIPAMPSRRPGRGATRMQVAAATLSRNKLLKLVSGGGKGGESIQLDHDYCSSSASPTTEVAPPKSFYHSNASEYVSDQSEPSSSRSKDSEESCTKPVLGENKVYSRLPEYYVVLAPQKALDKGRKGGSVKEEVWDKNSRKDSGLESGEVSDASEETIATPLSTGSRDVVSSNVKCEDRKCVKNIVPSSSDNGVVMYDIQNKTDIFDRKKPTSVLRGEGGPSVLKDWSTVRQDNGLCKPVAMVSVLKKNNVGCATNTPVRQQSLLISSNNNSNRNCNANSSNTSSVNTSSGSAISPNLIETEKNKSEGTKKKKLNLEEYRSRLKEMDRSRTKEESTSTDSLSLPGSSSAKQEINVIGTKDNAKEGNLCEIMSCISQCSVTSDEKAQRPVMHSVEVQTQTAFEEVPENNEKSKDTRSRKKQRKYCSKRASSSSSSHSTSSGSSNRHRKSRSQMRRKTSRRRSNGGLSVSSSGSQRPRSRSNSSRSSSSFSSSYSSRSRSRSHSRSRSRSSARRSPSGSHTRSSYQPRYGYRRPLPYAAGWRSRSRSPPFGARKSDWMLSEREKQRQVEERRVIYVGRIDEGTSKAELRRRFEPFGPIIDISVHFREHGDNYGFVTFAYKVDAYEAVEHGNDDPNLPRYDLCFGGRRAFCKTRYADLDGIATSDGPVSSSYSRGGVYTRRTDSQTEDFDLLLREAQAKLRKRKV